MSTPQVFTRPLDPQGGIIGYLSEEQIKELPGIVWVETEADLPSDAPVGSPFLVGPKPGPYQLFIQWEGDNAPTPGGGRLPFTVINGPLPMMDGVPRAVVEAWRSHATGYYLFVDRGEVTVVNLVRPDDDNLTVTVQKGHVTTWANASISAPDAVSHAMIVTARGILTSSAPGPDAPFTEPAPLGVADMSEYAKLANANIFTQPQQVQYPTGNKVVHATVGDALGVDTYSPELDTTARFRVGTLRLSRSDKTDNTQEALTASGGELRLWAQDADNTVHELSITPRTKLGCSAEPYISVTYAPDVSGTVQTRVVHNDTLQIEGALDLSGVSVTAGTAVFTVDPSQTPEDTTTIVMVPVLADGGWGQFVQFTVGVDGVARLTANTTGNIEAAYLSSMMVYIGPRAAAVRAASEPTVDERVDINTAPFDELTTVHRIGPHFAHQIIALREERDEPITLSDLTSITGISQSVVDHLSDKIKGAESA